jgi:WD40 repeat protein
MTIRLSIAFCVLASFVLVGCDTKSPTNGDKGTNGPSEVKTGPVLATTTEIRPAATPDATPNPVTVPLANVVVLRKLDLSPEVDGAVKWIGVEIDEATAAKLDPVNVYRHVRDKKETIYGRLKPGVIVKRGQVIALLDDEQAYLQWKAATAKAAAAKTSAEAYEVTVAKLKEIVTQTADGVARGIIPKQELLNSQATLARYQADLVEKQGSASVAIEEAATAKSLLEKRTLRAAVDGEVQQILKHEGEGVKAQEPMLVVQDFGSLRAIGNLPKEYANSIFHGDDVTIEVPRDTPPSITFEQHTTNKPIVAVAVGVANGKPVILSVGEDGWVYVWDRDLKVLAAGKSSSGVRSLAVTRPGIEPALALVGGIDGTARLYNLSTPSNKPIREFEGRHEGGVTAAAFSPDGRYCVTSDERGIFMYEVATGKKKYDFPAREHHSAITSLCFTPQGRVVSAGREPSVRVWIAGTEGAKVEHQIDSRSGDISMPGVTDDGSRLLLDADKGHLDVIHLQDLRKERPLATAGESARFSTFACWSPELNKNADDRRIATTGAAEGVIQLWKAPTSKDRASEVARFVTRGGAAVTCAAFCPVGDNCFLVVGTQKGAVHLWPLPAADSQTEVAAKVTHVDASIESSGRTVNVLVDFDNPKVGETARLLRPGQAVTLVIRPKK